MRMLAKSFGVSTFLIFLLITVSSKANIIEPPVNQTVLLEVVSEFSCIHSTEENVWLINGITLDAENETEYQQRGIARAPFRMEPMNNHVESRLQVQATAMNNNTEIKCVAGDAESAPAFLTIQGPPDAPPNLTIEAINMTTLHLRWLAPFVLNISNTPMYYIRIKDMAQGTSINTTSDSTEYYYSPDSCQLKTYEVCVAAGYSSLGSGPYSDPVMVKYKFLVLSSPNFTSTLSQFACEALCDASLLVTWLINGRFPSQLGNQLSVKMESNYSECDSQDTYTTTLEVVTETLAPYTVQCVVVTLCNQGDETTPCTPEICYSREVNAAPSNSVSTVSTMGPTNFNSQHNASALAVGFGLGIVVIFCLILIFILSAIICWKIVKRKLKDVDSNSEIYKQPEGNRCEEDYEQCEAKNTVYEQCGDPSVVADMVRRDTGSADLLYDNPSPPHPPPQPVHRTEACVTYDHPKPQLVTEPCVAYEVVKQPSD